MRRIVLFFIAILFFGSCENDDDYTKNEEPPFITDAGKDFLNVGEFKVNLNADALKENENGVWTIYSGLVDEKVFFEDDKNPKTIFHGLPGEQYKLIWTLTTLGKTATDNITVTFAPLKVEITNLSPSFYKTRLHLSTDKYDRGIWSVEGFIHHIENRNFGGTVIPAEESPHIIFYGMENTSCKLTWTTWYGSKSASASITLNAGAYQQDEALEDLSVDDRQYKKDENGNVIELNMHGLGTAWSFRDINWFPALQSLKHLKKLYLSGSGFYDFPEVITSNYLDLEVLYIAHNAFSSIPESIGNLTKLDTLIMNVNQEGKVVGPLPEGFGKLTKLRYLDIWGMGISNLPESFGNLTSLNYLDLEGNSIDKLPESFGNLKNLETFRGPRLQQNIPNSFSNLEKLKFCYFFKNSGTAELPDDFGKLKNLETLWLFGNYQSLPDSFTNLTSLKDLRMAVNQLPHNFGNLINLENVSIAGNFKTLPDSFCNLTNLKNLELHGILEQLPIDIGKLKNLEFLSVNSMNLEKIPDSFGDLENLKTFSAYQNDIGIIPDSFGDLAKIYKVDLSYNKISHFPSTMANLSDTLFDLTIRGNNYSEQELNALKQMLPNARITTN